MKNHLHIVKPTVALESFIDAFFFMELDSGSNTLDFEHRQISNGNIELFIGYEKANEKCSTGQETIFQFNMGLIGVHDLKKEVTTQTLRHIPQTLKFLEISFTPNGFYEIFKIPPSEIYNEFFECDMVLGNELRDLQTRLFYAKTFMEKTKLIESFLLKRLIKNRGVCHKLHQGFNLLDYIKLNGGNIRMKNLSDEFNLTERSLQRNLKNSLGPTPKEFCKITRINGVFDHIVSKTQINWMDLVINYGYYDQTHLINEFKEATGITPGIFVHEKDKTIYKVFNHLVSIRNTPNKTELHKVMAHGQESFIAS